MAKKAPKFRPMDKVIWFCPSGPVEAWVINDNLYRPMMRIDGTWWVKVSRHLEEAENGRGQSINAIRLRPFTDSMWRVCEHIIREREKLDKLEDTLKKGRIPKEFLQEQLL